MTDVADGDPSQDELVALHEALVAGDVTASARLAQLLLPAVRRRFANRRDLDPTDIESLVGESIAKYVANPTTYDPARAPLLAYLYRDVDADILNEIAKRSRRPRERPADAETLEFRAPHGNLTPEDEVVDRLDPLDLPRHLVQAARDEIARLSHEDREFLRLRTEGVRSTQAYAEVLGIAHVSKDQRQREVKRAKDRLDKRLGSIRDRLG